MREGKNLLGNFDPTSTFGIVQEGQASVGNTIWKPDYKDFSPRLGFAWDVTGKGTTVVRAGASIIYSSFVAASFVGAAGPNNFPGGNLSAVPTAACQTAPTAGNPCPANGTYGGTIDLGTVRYTGGYLNWDPTLNSALNGRVVFPAERFYFRVIQCNVLADHPILPAPYHTY